MAENNYLKKVPCSLPHYYYYYFDLRKRRIKKDV
jgi:hypothetical protein